MQAKRTISPSDLLSTPDPDRFPLTAPYAADGTRRRPGAVYIRESERDQGVYSFDTPYERARDVLLHHGFYVAMVRADSKTGSKISRTGYKDVEQAAHSGLIVAVGVYMMARWGRRASERLRISVEWTPEVELLLFVGLLMLAPEPIAPRALSKNERAAERARRYRARKAAMKRGAA
jgi:hypothetical protein